MTNPRQDAINHAAACRAAIERDEPRLSYNGANLRGADLLGANLRGADLRGADLRGADLVGADLVGADLYGANLYGAHLRDANLRGANLYGANLRYADLRGVNLRGADLRGANLRGANLRYADLRGAVTPDGRTWEEYTADPLAGICDTPEARSRAHSAWGKKSWLDCPLHAGVGANGFGHWTDADKRKAAAFFVACHDVDLLPLPKEISDV